MNVLDRKMNRRSIAAITAGTIAVAPFAKVLGQLEYDAAEDLSDLEGEFEADGSSTLGPLTEAAIEDFAAVAPNVQITNGISGSGGGFSRFANGETAISNASREIKEEEAELAAENGIDWYRFDMAYDGITVTVSTENDFIDELTTEELAQIWAADGPSTWNEVREDWPEEAIELYGPGTASGTFDFFNEEILGDDTEVRTDYTPSEDDNVLVQGVSGSPYALGYFGYSYYEENSDILKAVAINGVSPDMDTIGDGSYTPLSRSLFIYVNAADLQEDKAVGEFVKFFAANSSDIAPSVGYIGLPEDVQQETLDKVIAAIDGEVEPDSASFGTEEGTPEEDATPAS